MFVKLLPKFVLCLFECKGALFFFFICCSNENCKTIRRKRQTELIRLDNQLAINNFINHNLVYLYQSVVRHWPWKGSAQLRSKAHRLWAKCFPPSWEVKSKVYFLVFDFVRMTPSLSRSARCYVFMSPLEWASQVAQRIKNLSAVQKPQETWVWSWVGKIRWRREWPPTPVSLPGESHGQRSPVGYSPWGPWSQTRLKRLNTHTLPLNSAVTLPGSHSDVVGGRVPLLPAHSRSAGAPLWIGRW